MTRQRRTVRGSQPPVHGRRMAERDPPRALRDDAGRDHDTDGLDASDPNEAPVAADLHEHHDPPTHSPRMTAHHALRPAARARPYPDGLAVAANDDPVPGNPHADAGAMAAQ